MDKKLQESSLDFVISQILGDGSLKNAKNYETYYNSIISLSQNSKFEFAKQIIQYLLKFFQRDNTFKFPKLVLESKILYSCTDTPNTSPIAFFRCLLFYLKQKNDKKELDSFKPIIKKCLIFIKEHLSNIYLLIHSKSAVEKVYFALENATLIHICNNFVDFLNQFQMVEEADFLFMLNQKLNLGFERYNFNRKYQKILSFAETGEYLELSNIEILDLLLIHNFNSEYTKLFIETNSKTFLNSSDFKLRLKFLLLLKNTKSEYKKELLKNENYLEKFPEFIFEKKNYELELEISKSITNVYEEQIIDLEKEKKILRNLNSLDIANLILEF